MVSRRQLLAAAAGGALLGGLPSPTVAEEPDDTLHFLAWNTWLLEPVEIFGWVPYAKPQMDERAREIGDALETVGYDVMALCEVFATEDQETITSRLSGEIDERAGPPQTWRKVSGGVHTIARDYEITRWTAEAFADNGELTGDADAWSNKGVLYTEIDLGVGAIDLFSTHMFAGDGGADPVETRASQLAQLQSMVERWSKPQNVTIVAGDLNIHGESAEYERTVVPFLEELGLVDLWPAHHPDDPGGTGTSGIVNGCDVDPDDGLPYYCRGLGPNPADTSRIDYVIVEEPTAYHDLALEVRAIERASFWRGKAEPGQFFADEAETVPNYLSDHIGVDVVFDVYDVEPTAEPPEQDDDLPPPDASPGFGLLGAVAGLGAAGYLYSRRGGRDA